MKIYVGGITEVAQLPSGKNYHNISLTVVSTSGVVVLNVL